jgi:hypothetical protein
VSTEPLPSNDVGIIQLKQNDEGFMKYAAEMGSVAMIYIPSFMNIGLAIQRLIREDSHIHRQHGDHICLLYERRIKMPTKTYTCLVSGTSGFHILNHNAVFLRASTPTFRRNNSIYRHNDMTDSSVLNVANRGHD